MQLLIDEIDIPLMTKYLMIGDTGPCAPIKIRSKICNLSLHYFPLLLSYKKVGKVVYTVNISFDSSSYSHTRDDFQSMFLDEDGDNVPWNDQLYQFFKDYIIEEIWVNKYPMDEE